MKQESKKPTKQHNAWLPKLSLFTYNHSKTLAVMWLALTIFGVVSYTTLLKREGFPSVDAPFSVVNGTYVVNDSAKVDAEVAKPIADILLKDDRVDALQSSARGTFYALTIRYKDGTNAQQASKELQARVEAAKVLPPQASMKFTTPKFGFTARGDDAVVSLYAKDSSKTTAQLAAEGEKLAAFIADRHLSMVQSVSLLSPFASGFDPATGKQIAIQTIFDRYGVRQDNTNTFFDSVVVGVMQKKGADVIVLDEQLRAAVADYNKQTGNSSFVAAVSASYAPDIKTQISELQRALFEGMLAVLVVGSIVIAIRASIITVLAMLTVLATTIAILLGIGYSLNTITLFSLILCLALIVDDTIIMVEAIDAQRRKRKDPQETVRVATGKISRAMVAATSTAALSFAPLLFVGGILGSFIQAIPVTVITSLLISLAVALIFIPVFARYLLLGKKQMGEGNVREPAAGVEAKIAGWIVKPMLWARNSGMRLFGVGMVAVILGLSFIAASGFLFQKVTFNIFPPTKDTNYLTVTLNFPPGRSIEPAIVAAREADKIVAKTLGDNFVKASYYATGGATGGNQMTRLFIEVKPYDKRDIRSPQMVAQLEDAFKGFRAAKVEVNQQDVGPPASPFTIRLQTTDRAAAQRLAADLQIFLQDRKLVRPSGKEATITATSVSDPNIYERTDGKSDMHVTATFDGDDTSTLVSLAQTAVEKEFTAEKLQTYGLPKDTLQFDFGQESRNQESFATLLYAFPAVLFAIYLLLSFQFRSLIQPLLIFMAIPFSLFGITLGLYLTDNAFSFFAMLGFFALIGLSLKNTILLTDYANQQRRAGVRAVDAAAEALRERFRPLIATSFTAVVSLLPLAVMSPFWEGLAVVLICGLLSSTLLVIIVFPYYYLGVEFMRAHVSRRACLTWLGLTILLSVVLVKVGVNPGIIPLVALLLAVGMGILAKRRHRVRAA